MGARITEPTSKFCSNCGKPTSLGAGSPAAPAATSPTSGSSSSIPQKKKKNVVRERIGGVVLAIELIMLLGVGVGYTTFLVVSDSRELKTFPNPFSPGKTSSYWDKQTPFDATSNMSRWIITGSILTIAGMIILHDRGIVNGVGLAFMLTGVALGFTSIIYLAYLIFTENNTEVIFHLGIVSIIWLFVGYVIKSASAGGRGST